MLISPCNLNFNGLKIKDELKGENKSKVFTVTISVPSVKKGQVHYDMSKHVFYSGVDIVHFELNSIQLRIMLYSDL